MTMLGVILYVEDDDALREEVAESLSAFGYVIQQAANGVTALAFLRQGAPVIGLVTDIDLGPGPNGWEVARRARELLPNLAVVYLSSGSEGRWSAVGVSRSIFISKPFDSSQIAATLSFLLG